MATLLCLPSPLTSCWVWPPPALPAKPATAFFPSSSPIPPPISMLLPSTSSPISLLMPVISVAPVCRWLTAFGWSKLFLLSPLIKNSWKGLMTLFLNLLTSVPRYLQGSSAHSLLLQSSTSSPTLQAYSDADWAGCPDSSRSTSGFAIFFGPNLVSWKSKKQPTVSRSSTEAEYRAIAYTVQDMLHIRSILFELGVPIRHPVQLLCDNVSSSYLSTNPIQHARSKHISIDYHFVRERVSHGDLVVRYVPTQFQLADIFTKCLSPQRFIFLRDNLRIVSPTQLEGV
ncbi:unnamed protein product [Cuscuta epithymum]|uniref:Uncharacterized protein n=1 Tax=Cuscuta epithymum TaxID=186058 RepID=A0AAV0D394_9ASTE|nr:unnamed protein product [Cuscuta epithymum]